MDLAITLDYELFGNGTGNVFSDIILPTKKILKLCKQFNAKITIFFEVVEYWKLCEEWENGNSMGYSKNPCKAIENQLKNALIDGHDLQLHVHPQWLGAQFINGKWNCTQYWSMIDIENFKKEFKLNLYEVIKNGKETIEKICREIYDDYSCNIFRAGGFNILPSEKIIQILYSLGFRADSSVFAGGFKKNDFSDNDFRKISNKIPYWFLNDFNVTNQNEEYSQNALLELPVFACKIPNILRYNINRLMSFFKYTGHKEEVLINDKNHKLPKIFKIKKLFQNDFATLDICLFDKYLMRYVIKVIKRIAKESDSKYFPIVAIAHSKNFLYEKGFVELLKTYNINFITLSEICNKIDKIER